MKTISGAKKRFRTTSSGKLVRQCSGKRHGMIKRTPKQIRNLRGTTLISASDSKMVRRHYLTNGSRSKK